MPARSRTASATDALRRILLLVVCFAAAWILLSPEAMAQSLEPQLTSDDPAFASEEGAPNPLGLSGAALWGLAALVLAFPVLLMWGGSALSMWRDRAHDPHADAPGQGRWSA